MTQPVIPAFDGEFRFLSNFAPSPIRIQWATGDLTFPTGEHMFQAAKWTCMVDTNLEARKKYVTSVLSNDDPNHAKQMGRRVKIVPGFWDLYRDEAMRSVVFEKFKQNDDLRGLLLATGPAMLVEGNTWGDTYWGRCKGEGYNKLGAILMEVRGYYYWRDNATDL